MSIRAENVTRSVTAPSFVFCGASPVIAPIFAAAGLSAVSFVIHQALWVVAPLNLLLLTRGYRRHHHPAGLILGGLGTLSIFLHLFGHTLQRNILPLIWGGTVLLVAGTLADRRAELRHLNRDLGPEEIEAYWRAVLSGEHPGLRRGRNFYGLLPRDPRCKLCNAPFAGPGAVVGKLAGKGPSGKNPNFCGDCLAKTPVGGAEAEISMLFADIRGSTSLAEKMGPSEFAGVLNRFYQAATRVLVRRSALVDRFVGDEVIGLFVPGYAGPDHASKAVAAARDLLEATGNTAGREPWVPVGAGVHVGTAFVGVVGSNDGVTDITALGDPVNATARLASMAAAGEILVSEDACAAAGLDISGLERRELRLKGRREPLTVRVLTVGSATPDDVSSQSPENVG
ncbi:MAG TPA: MerC family mercury resistance protein [Actinomycetota bacterium]|nr:MerC family mercury resistance protein [Actinomycetota bacterium]